MNFIAFCGRKKRYSNFTTHSPRYNRCAGDIFKVLLKFKMAATTFQLFVGAKTQNLLYGGGLYKTSRLLL